MYITLFFILYMILRPTRSTRTDTLLPSTPLFRSTPGVALHRARQTNAEWLLRELQRAHARRTAQRNAVPEPPPRPCRNCRPGAGLQPGTPALIIGIRDPSGVRR